MTRAHRQTVAAIMVPMAFLLACNTPEAVAKFCSSAVVTLKSGDAIFDDMKASCVREARSREILGSFAVQDPAPAVCSEIGNRADGLKSAAKLVAIYYGALNDLASFGTSKAGSEAKGLINQVTAHSPLSAASQKALGAIGEFLVRAATSGYQRKHLADDLVKANEDIEIVLLGLGEATGAVYVNQLLEEEKKTATRYKSFLLEHGIAVEPGAAGNAQNPTAAEAILILDTRWETERANFTSKRKAAVAYQAALLALAKGHAELASHARDLRARELFGILGPYAAQLDSLLPAIQKAFL